MSISLIADSDTLEEQDYMTETLQKMDENRDENKKLLKQKKSLIIKQISATKSKVLKYLDEIDFTVYFRRWWYS
jgi:restriction endonuclease S subunit